MTKWQNTSIKLTFSILKRKHNLHHFFILLHTPTKKNICAVFLVIFFFDTHTIAAVVLKRSHLVLPIFFPLWQQCFVANFYLFYDGERYILVWTGSTTPKMLSQSTFLPSNLLLMVAMSFLECCLRLPNVLPLATEACCQVHNKGAIYIYIYIYKKNQ